MWDLWWDKVALGRFSPSSSVSPAIVVRSTNYSTITLMYHPGNAQWANVWPQCWDLQGPRGLKQRYLRNLNLGDLKKGPNGGLSPTPPKKTLWKYNSKVQQNQ
jgi:hypothetical protein